MEPVPLIPPSMWTGLSHFDEQGKKLDREITVCNFGE
jgi:hypothetical protein